MKFHVVPKLPKNLDAINLVAIEGGKEIPLKSKLVDSELQKFIERELKELKFKGKTGEVAVLRTSKNIPAKRLIITGLGKPPIDLDRGRQAIAGITQTARSLHLKSIGTEIIGQDNKSDIQAVTASLVEGLLLADYHFHKYQKQDEPKVEIEVYFAPADQSKLTDVQKGLKQGQAEAAAVILARDLVNEPPSHMNPARLASVARQIAKDSGLKVEIKGPREIEKMGLRAYYAVSKGSDEPPQFIKLQYSPPGAKKHIVLVGKGVTFDSGGINIKPSKGGMLEAMKMDMAGGAAVIASMSALKELSVPVKVTAYVAATENLLGGSAYKPGDVVHAFNGKSIEVGNTDAEGRLTLADALSYSVAKDKPDEIIDLATLTGAAIVALGQDIAALFSNKEELAKKFEDVSKITGEKVWRLPLPEEYNELIKGHITDLHNTGGGSGAGTITAALFLQNFVGDTPWVHLDIAGPAWAEKDKGYIKKGGTGYGVRTLLHYLKTA